MGNGKDSNSRSNAHTVDWAGNAWFAGKIYSGGTGQDDGAAAEVALKTDIPDAIVTPESAMVGQSIVVQAVDEAGKPTSWAAETVVKQINGKAPDDTGNVESFHSVSFNFIDGSAVVPGLIQYYGKETMAEIYAYYQEASVYNVECCRFIMGQGNTVQQRWCIATETIKDNGAVTRLRLYFGDDIAPVIMDIVNNKLYFDPDWTKPADLPNPDAGNHMLVTDAEGQTSWAERTHYVEMIPDVVLPEITVTAKSAFLKNYGAYTRNLEKEHTYHIVCDGVEYSCVPAWNESLYGYTIGNAALASAGEDTGEPFFINSHMNTDMTIIYFAKDGTHTFSIDEGFIEHVHPLDMKYMPAGVVKSVNGIAPDESGDIKSDIAFPVLITHLKFPMFDDIKPAIQNWLVLPLVRGSPQHKGVLDPDAYTTDMETRFLKGTTKIQALRIRVKNVGATTFCHTSSHVTERCQKELILRIDRQIFAMFGKPIVHRFHPDIVEVGALSF